MSTKQETPRCELCGRPNPGTDDGYTACCNELVIYPGEQGYAQAKREWAGVPPVVETPAPADDKLALREKNQSALVSRDFLAYRGGVQVGEIRRMAGRWQAYTVTGAAVGPRCSNPYAAGKSL